MFDPSQSIKNLILSSEPLEVQKSLLSWQYRFQVDKCDPVERKKGKGKGMMKKKEEGRRKKE